MQEHNSRIAIRLPMKERKRIDKLVEAGQFKNLSQVIRAALTHFLKNFEDFNVE